MKLHVTDPRLNKTCRHVIIAVSIRNYSENIETSFESIAYRALLIKSYCQTAKFFPYPVSTHGMTIITKIYWPASLNYARILSKHKTKMISYSNYPSDLAICDFGLYFLVESKS